jgi:hypothetical protein
MDNGKIRCLCDFLSKDVFEYLEHVIEVDQDHHVNHHVRNTVIVPVVHVIEVNTDVVRTMMANIVVNIDDVEKFNIAFFDISEKSKHAIW